WRSNAFGDSLRFAASDVESVQFPRAAKPRPPDGPYCFELAGGDTLYGSLVALDEREATIHAPGLGTLHVDRAGLHRFYRASAADLVFAGPGGLSGWETPDSAKDWRDVGGKLRATQPGDTLRSDFRHPPMARYE